jgi:hypothetical protein
MLYYSAWLSCSILLYMKLREKPSLYASLVLLFRNVMPLPNASCIHVSPHEKIQWPNTWSSVFSWLWRGSLHGLISTEIWSRIFSLYKWLRREANLTSTLIFMMAILFMAREISLNGWNTNDEGCVPVNLQMTCLDTDYLYFLYSVHSWLCAMLPGMYHTLRKASCSFPICYLYKYVVSNLEEKYAMKLWCVSVG